MTEKEFNAMKYTICCPFCDLKKCVKGTVECEAERWKKSKEPFEGDEE